MGLFPLLLKTQEDIQFHKKEILTPLLIPPLLLPPLPSLSPSPHSPSPSNLFPPTSSLLCLYPSTPSNYSFSVFFFLFMKCQKSLKSFPDFHIHPPPPESFSYLFLNKLSFLSLSPLLV